MAGVIRDESGRYFVARRRASKKYGGCWEFPGGKVEAGESDGDALIREFREEFGVVAVPGGPVAERSGDGIVLACLSAGMRGSPTRMPDHDAIAWLPLAELLRLPLTGPDAAVAAGFPR